MDGKKGLVERLFYPLYAIAARVLVRSGVRFIHAPMIYEHIGHLAGDFDSYLKDQILSRRKVVPVFLCAGRKPANEALVAHWSRYVRFIRSRWIDRLLRPFMSFPELVASLPALGYFNAPRGAARGYDVQRRWADREPLLHLSEAEIARGEAQLRALGIPEGAWFVCVHCREAGFLAYSEWANSYRNASIVEYGEAMREIVARGGWCVRVGDPTMQPLAPTPGVVDYALSSAKSDWMDVFLCARCRFFLGSSSGLFVLAGIFGRPIAVANMTPLGAAYSPFPRDLSIPKMLRDAQGRTIPFPELFADEASGYHFASEFAERGLTHVGNAPLEIAELAAEMMDRLDGRVVDQPDDADLQARFRALVQPRHYSWPAPSRVGRAFLRRHRALLENAQSSGSARFEEAR